MIEQREKIIIDNINYNIVFKQKNVRRMTLKVLADSTIVVIYNNRISFNKVMDFVQKNGQWIKTVLAGQRLVNATLAVEECLSGEKTWLLGKLYDVKVNIQEDEIILDETKILISDKVKDFEKVLIKNYIGNIYRIYDDIYNKYFATILPEAKLEIKRMKSRWGSCKYKENKIVLNSALIHLEYELIHYVAVHEYVHFLHPNHSQLFYNELSKFIPNYKKIKSKLKQYAFILLI